MREIEIESTSKAIMAAQAAVDRSGTARAQRREAARIAAREERRERRRVMKAQAR